MEFGKAVRVMRAVRGISQKDLAYAIGVNPVVLWQVENGSLPREYVQQQIREALGWTPEMDAALDVLAQVPEALPFSEGAEGEA